MEYLQHPLSAAFPAMTSAEFQELKDSIEINGLFNPVTILDGMVLDGWHRYKACLALGILCPAVELEEGIDPKDFVLAQNKNRRHISASQLAIATTSVYEWLPSHRPNKSVGTTELLKTTKELAKISGVSESSIEKAKSILRNAEPEVQDAVKSGKIGLEKAGKIAKLPKDQQAAAINKPIISPKHSRLNKNFEAGTTDPKPSILDGNTPSDEELRANEMAMQADQELLNKLLDSNEPLKVAHEELTKLNFLNSQLKVRIDSLMSEKNEAITLCKKLQKQLDKASKK